MSAPDPSSGEAVGAIEVKGVYAAYQRQQVLTDINLSLKKGIWTAVMGPNGAGKSTLFHLLTGGMAPLEGNISALGEPIKAVRRKGQIAYMAQKDAIEWDFPISVRDCVMSGRFGHMRLDPWHLRLLPMRKPHRRHQLAVDNALAAVDMQSHAHRHIDALSGGQKKRVLLARCLAQGADILLLDEPLAGVDTLSEALILDVLAGERAAGKTVIMVTHDMPGARQRVDEVVLINGVIKGVGSPSVMLTEARLAELAVSRTASEPIEAKGGTS